MTFDNGGAAVRKKQAIRNYRDLLVWQKAMSLVEEVYQLTSRFPSDERFGLVAQLRRAAVSIPSNIAEGQARKSTREFVQFLSLAEGSLAEVDTQLLLSERLGLCAEHDVRRLFSIIEEIRKMLMALSARLNER
ncbi:MAG TPA: four helix bundle protein [Candidatus Acidoferrales bacterium]|nr:four helix bundle protein [Candidatus Acidoferrales bacterium]